MKSIICSFILFNIEFLVCNGVDVQTSSGLIRGHTIEVLNQNINEFLGIPYAEPPIGDLRFAKPKPIDKPLPVSRELSRTNIQILYIITILPLIEEYIILLTPPPPPPQPKT